MGNLFLVIFLILFGIMNLISTEIPHWVLGVAAIVAAIALAIGGGWFDRRPPG